MAEIKTSFSFSLGSDSTQNVSAEIDQRTAYEDGDNATRLGKTSGFDSGEDIGFLVYLPPDYLVEHITTSLDSIGASVSSHGEVTQIFKTEKITFNNRVDTKKTLNHYVRPTTILDGQWIGNDLGAVTLLSDQISIKIPQLPPDATLEQQRTTGIYNVTYQARAFLFRLHTPSPSAMILYGRPPYSVNVVIYCKKA